jgi:hypothetical protein
MTWVAMHIQVTCFVLLACFVLWRSARFGLRLGPRPKVQPQMTPWHPELGHKKALAVRAGWGLVFLLGIAAVAGIHDHLGTVHFQQPAQILAFS